MTVIYGLTFLLCSYLKPVSCVVPYYLMTVLPYCAKITELLYEAAKGNAINYL